MARPALGAAVREGARAGVVVGHPGRGNMVDVQFSDVSFVERRAAERLSVVPAGTKRAAGPRAETERDWADDHKRATVEAIYERLVTEHLGKKAFRNAKGERIDVLALNKGTLTREEVNDLVGRAFAIATSSGRAHGDVGRNGAKATTSGRALSALRGGSDPRLVERQMRAIGASDEEVARVLRLSKGKSRDEVRQRLEDYEQTLTLRRVANPRPPLRRNFIGAALRAGGAAIEAGTAAFRGAARVAPVAAREAGVLASEGRALAETGATAARESFRAFLKTPQGKAFAAQITTTVTALFGAEVARRAHLTPEQTALVQRTMSRKTGENVDPELISAAIRSSKRK